MIIVSGEPRSGTSLTMEICRLLGVTIWGSEQPRETKDERLKAKAAYLNEKFWEVPQIVTSGIQLDRLRRQMGISQGESREQIKELIKKIYSNADSAVKIIWNGLVRTDQEILGRSKILLCLRNPFHIAVSQQNLESNVHVSGSYKENPAFVSPKLPLISTRYLQSALRFSRWAAKPSNQKLPLLVVDYDDTIDNPLGQIQKIANFLEIDTDLGPAIAAVNARKRRSAQENTSPDDDWAIAEEVYELLKIGEYGAVATRLEDRRKQKESDPENVGWLDEGTFFPVKPALWRRMQDKPEMLAKMVASKEKRKATGALCTDCPLYNRQGENYTIITPYDVPDIVRRKVACKDEGQVTLEQCQQHWGQIRKNAKWRQDHKLPTL